MFIPRPSISVSLLFNPYAICKYFHSVFVLFIIFLVKRWPRSSVRVATGYGLDGPGIEKIIPVGAKFFSHVQTGPGFHPASCTMGTGSFPGIKLPGRGADRPPPPSTEVENEWGYNSSPPLGPSWPVIG
jgi:hypothetical protein